VRIIQPFLLRDKCYHTWGSICAGREAANGHHLPRDAAIEERREQLAAACRHRRTLGNILTILPPGNQPLSLSLLLKYPFFNWAYLQTNHAEKWKLLYESM
jgi:hypothetical protein